LCLVVVAGEFLVRGAVGLAEKLGIPPLILGLTVVSFGTSAPEMVISVQAAINGFPGISLGNVIGSNIANVLLVLGIPGLIYATTCKVDNLTKNTLFMVFVTFVFMGFAFMGTFQLWHGLVLLGLLAGYVYMAAVDARKKGDVTEEGLEDEVGAVPHSTWLAVLFLLLGLVGLPIAAHFTVDSATQIARVWGISEALIGLTIVAVGTSLPELAATAVAAYKKQSGLALGNVVGSNIYNLCGILGLTAVIHPIEVPAEIARIDIWVMLGVTALLIVQLRSGWRLSRIEGALLVLLYCGYTAFLALR
jgi:cation:H+ antiporter